MRRFAIALGVSAGFVVASAAAAHAQQPPKKEATQPAKPTANAAPKPASKTTPKSAPAATVEPAPTPAPPPAPAPAPPPPPAPVDPKITLAIIGEDQIPNRKPWMRSTMVATFEDAM